jgi:glutamine amidotransferase
MEADYYFIHSYYFKPASEEAILAVCEYGISFPCVVGSGVVFGTQFHPEKSHQFGLRILENFFKVPCLKNV